MPGLGGNPDDSTFQARVTKRGESEERVLVKGMPSLISQKVIFKEVLEHARKNAQR